MPNVTYLERGTWQDATEGAQIEQDLLRPLLQTSGKFWIAVGICGLPRARGRGRIRLSALHRHRRVGHQLPVFWAFDITNFVFWIGISHAGTLISAILRLCNASWRRPVTRCAEAITAFALMIGGIFPLCHLGRPWLSSG